MHSKAAPLYVRFRTSMCLLACGLCIAVVISTGQLMPDCGLWYVKGARGCQSLPEEAAPIPLAGYVIAGSFREQLSKAMVTYFQLAEIASYWNMKIVEPLVERSSSGLAGLPKTIGKDLRIGHLYNTSAVYKELDDCLQLRGQQLISTLEDFLASATRQFVILNFLKNEELIGKTPDVFDCTKSTATQASALEQKVNHYFKNDGIRRKAMVANHSNGHKFEAVLTLCVNGWHFSLENVTSHLVSAAKRLSPAQYTLTVIVPEWRQISRSSMHSFFYSDPKLSLEKYKSCNAVTLPHSQKVLVAAESLFNSLNPSQPIVAVHIRIEKLAISENHHKGMWLKCLENFERAVHSMKLKHDLAGLNIIALHDQGKYGSKSCLPACARIKADFKTALDKLGGRVVYYEPTAFGAQANKAFVSLVEKEFLSMADYLIPIGGGLYQNSAVLRFLERHPNQSSLNTMCIS